MKHIILAAALLAFGAPAFATEPAPSHRASGGTAAFSASGAALAGTGHSTARVETGNVSMGHAQITHGAQRSLTTSDSYGIGASTGHGSFAGAGHGYGGAFTIGPLSGHHPF